MEFSSVNIAFSIVNVDITSTNGVAIAAGGGKMRFRGFDNMVERELRSVHNHKHMRRSMAGMAVDLKDLKPCKYPYESRRWSI